MGSQPLDPSYALRAENAELRKLVATLRAERDAAVAEAERWKRRVEVELKNLEAEQARAGAAIKERDEARRERDNQKEWASSLVGRLDAAETDLAALRRRVEEALTFPFVYLHGGYFRDSAVPRGDKAELLHGMEAVEWVSERVRAALASPPVAAQGTRESATQPDAPGREEQRELIDADACGHLWVEHQHRCNLKRGHPGGDPELHEYCDGAGKMLAGWVDDVNEERP